LTKLPPEIGRLTGLTALSLDRNRLAELSPEIGQLTALKALFLNSNQLTLLPPEIGQLTELTELSLQSNRITTLPQAIGRLTALSQLSLDNNELRALPFELSRLTGLRELYLHGNPSLGIPDAVLGCTYDEIYGVEGKARKNPARPADILNFYFARLKAAAQGALQRLNEIRVMLVGDGGAGKTSLRRFFKGEEHLAKEPETIGIALDTFPLRCGGETITVRLWDFAGQEITHALHQFFLTEGCVYLVVVEPRGDNEQGDAEKWLQLIERYAKGSPALVVMNKQDTRQPVGYDLDANALRERFPFIRGFAPTSCGASRTGCAELLEQLRAVLASMPETALQVPASWVRVKDACFARRMGRAENQFVSLLEFRDLCAQHGETDVAKQESLARLLHNLGAVLHFVDEPRLRETTVLNPHWVTDGVYRLLRCHDGPGSDGTLTLEHAMAASPGGAERATRYLLGLMERFEMCFTLSGTEDANRPYPIQRWLVPGALAKSQPDAVRAGEWQAPDAVRLRYLYDPLPQGVLPRFIVMTHLLSEGEPRWRFGVVLHDGAARALIRKGQKETVEVTVQGPPADRAKLVKTVRGYLARIHADLPGPKPREHQALAGTEDYREVEQLRELEEENVPIVTKTAAGTNRKVSATEELNRTSAEEPRTGNKRPLRVFFSYCRADKEAHGLFRNNLMALQIDEYITFWDDPQIEPSTEWRPEIDRELEEMDIFIGLMTTAYYTSEFIQRVELKRALERQKGKAKPAEFWLVVVDDRRIEGTKFGGFQVIRPEGNAVINHKHGMKGGFDAVEKEIFPRVKRLWDALPEREEGRRGIGGGNDE
jgi:small GTP-binding protein